MLTIILTAMSIYMNLLNQCQLSDKEIRTVTDNEFKVRHSNRVYDYLKRNYPTVFNNLRAVKEGNGMWLIIKETFN
jgi:hypothetical protein